MADPRVEKLAELLVNYSVEVRPGDWVLVRGHVLALPLVEQVVKQVTLAGGNPTVQLESDETEDALLQAASDEQLRWVSPLDELMAARLTRASSSAPRATPVPSPMLRPIASKSTKMRGANFPQPTCAAPPKAAIAGSSPTFLALPMPKKRT